MSDQPAAPATDAPSDTPTDQPADEPKPTETVDFWKQKAREQEKRAKENSSAAKRLAEIEEANKTEAQKTADALAAAQSDAEAAKAEALRYRIASKFGVSDENAALYLTATDEETLTKQAQGLSAIAAAAKKGGNTVAREGGNPTSAPNDEKQFVSELFKG